MDWYSVFWRQWCIFKRRFWKIFATSLINPLLFLTVFGWGLGRHISIEGDSYLHFVVPGIISLTTMNVSFNSIAIPLNISRLYHRTYEEFIMAPITSRSVVLGEAAAGCLRGFFGAVIVLGLSFAFGARINLVPLFWVILLLNSFLFSCLGIYAAMLINSHEDMNAFSSFVIVPMAFLSNTFFSTRDLPAAINLIINVLPLTHTSKSLRALALQHPFPWESLLVLVCFAALFYWLAVRVSLKAE